MFMAAGLITETLGHDRIAELGGIARTLPITMFAFALAGLSLMGVPPSGGFVAKWLLLSTSVVRGQWWWAGVILVGGLLASAYVFMVIGKALGRNAGQSQLWVPVSRRREIVPLSMAVCALLLGLLPLQPFGLLQIGRPPAPALTSR
jgi:multicomponent Na+:H+ antiporter subunit D